MKNGLATLCTQRANSLIEILVSLTILAIGTLGLAKWQLESLRLQNDAFLESIAGTQLQSMYERILANKKNYQHEISLWNLDNVRLLPNGYGEVSGTQPIIIKIQWTTQFSHQIKKLQCKVIL
jgi:type II secretory pathway pseudopilin PulG